MCYSDFIADDTADRIRVECEDAIEKIEVNRPDEGDDLYLNGYVHAMRDVIGYIDNKIAALGAQASERMDT